MKFYATSDHHFGHMNVIKHCNRPYKTIEEMDNDYVTKWNMVIKPNDLVYYLGDMFFYGKKNKVWEILKLLNGRIGLIKGNHDNWVPKFPESQIGKDIYNRFEFIKDYHEEKFGDNLVVMMHYPLRSWKKSHHGSFHLHGHCHSNLNEENKVYRRLDVGVDSHHGYPVLIDNAIDKLSSKDYNNHHGD